MGRRAMDKLLRSPFALASAIAIVIVVVGRFVVVLPTRDPCGTVLGLTVALFAHRIVHQHFDTGIWSSNLSRIFNVAALLHGFLFLVLAGAALIITYRTSAKVKAIVVVGIASGYLALLLLVPVAPDCP